MSGQNSDMSAKELIMIVVRSVHLNLISSEAYVFKNTGT